MTISPTASTICIVLLANKQRLHFAQVGSQPLGFEKSATEARPNFIILCHSTDIPDPLYRSSLPAGPQSYTPYPHRAALYRCELVSLPLLGHVTWLGFTIWLFLTCREGYKQSLSSTRKKPVLYSSGDIWKTLINIDLKTLVISVNVAPEVEPWLNKNNRKCTWHLK